MSQVKDLSMVLKHRYTILESIHERHNKENKVEVGMSPCLTPLSMAMASDIDPLKLNHPFISL